MILAWCVLRWGQLVFWSSQQDPMLARLMAAVAFTVASLLYVHIATSLIGESKEGGTPDFYALSGSIGLLVGQSWMTCFYRASAGFGIPAVAPEGDRLLLLSADQHQGEVW